MDKLHKQAKGYIQIEEMFRFWNEVRKGNNKADLHKSNKCQPFPKIQALHTPNT